MEVLSESSLDNLPKNVLDDFVKKLPISDLIEFCQSNRRIHSFCQDRSMWKDMAIKHYGVLSKNEARHFKVEENGKTAFIKLSAEKGYYYPGAESFVDFKIVLKYFKDNEEPLPEYFTKLYRTKLSKLAKDGSDAGDNELLELLRSYYDLEILEEVIHETEDYYLVEFLLYHKFVEFEDLYDLLTKGVNEGKTLILRELIYNKFTDDEIYELTTHGEDVIVKYILNMDTDVITVSILDAMIAGLLAVDNFDQIPKLVEMGGNSNNFMEYVDSDDDISDEAKEFLNRRI